MNLLRGNIFALVICSGLLAPYATTAHFAWRGKSATYDEPQHFYSSWLAVHDADYLVDAENPPLWKYYVAAGTNAGDMPVDLFPPRHTDEVVSFKALYRQAGVDPAALIDAARQRMILLTVVLEALTAWWAWRLAGPIAGVVALAFFCMDPNFLAHGPLVKNDVPITLAFMGLMAAIWLLGENATIGRIVATCLLVGAALNTKFSGILGIPMLAVALAIRAMLPEPWPVLGNNSATRRGRFAAAGGIFAATLVVSYAGIWACYDFRFVPAGDGVTRLDVNTFHATVAEREVIVEHGSPLKIPPEEFAQWKRDWRPHGVTSMVDWLSDRHLLPQSWLLGFLWTYAMSLYRPTFFCGEVGIMGWWYYFPMAMAFKTPLATIGAIFLGAGSLNWWYGTSSGGNRIHWLLVGGIVLLAIVMPILVFPMFDPGLREYLPNFSRIMFGLFLLATTGVGAWVMRLRISNLWPLMAAVICPVIYMIVAMDSHLNLGLRHVFPVYPFLFIFLGIAAARSWQNWPRAAGIVIPLLIVGLAVETFGAYPDYIPFFNAAVGGSNGGLHLLSDSNIDWGQELPDLAKWQQANPDRPMNLYYFGFADPIYYKIRASVMRDDSIAKAQRQISGPRAVFAISAVGLQGGYLEQRRWEMLEPFRHMKPIAVLGGSMYLFDTPPHAGNESKGNP